jgi:hypothetical protein
MRYFLSPEFHRQLWMRFTPLRLIAAPVMLGLCAVVAWNVGMHSRHSSSPEQAGFAMLVLTMQIIYFFVMLVWGTLEAGTAMATEMRSNTWDFQAMSSISPSQLAFGKFFGTTSYTWYFGLLTLGIFGYAYDHYQGTSWTNGTRQEDTLYVMAGYLLAALLGQSVALLNYLIDLSSSPGRTTRALLPGGMAAFLLGLAVSAAIFFNVLSNATHINASYHRSFRHGIQWYWNFYEYLPFVLCSLLFFCGWFLTGIYRLIRIELLYRNQPLVWVIFVLSLIAWDSGFFFCVPAPSRWGHRAEPMSIPSPDDALKAAALSRAAFWAFLQAAIITYGSMLNESADIRKYARFAFFAKTGDVRRMLENMPKWVATVPIVFISYFVVAMVKPPGEGTAELAYLTTSMTALLLFMLRDGLVVHAIHKLHRGRGGRFALIFYYIMAYGLLPLTALTISGTDIRHFFDSLGDVGATTVLGQITAMFYPIVIGNPMFSIFPPLAEVLLAAAGLLFVLRQNPPSHVIANPKA